MNRMNPGVSCDSSRDSSRGFMRFIRGHSRANPGVSCDSYSFDSSEVIQGRAEAQILHPDNVSFRSRSRSRSGASPGGPVVVRNSFRKLQSWIGTQGDTSLFGFLSCTLNNTEYTEAIQASRALSQWSIDTGAAVCLMNQIQKFVWMSMNLASCRNSTWNRSPSSDTDAAKFQR